MQNTLAFGTNYKVVMKVKVGREGQVLHSLVTNKPMHITKREGGKILLKGTKKFQIMSFSRELIL